jgi:hypothetical protein
MHVEKTQDSLPLHIAAEQIRDCSSATMPQSVIEIMNRIKIEQINPFRSPPRPDLG